MPGGQIAPINFGALIDAARPPEAVQLLQGLAQLPDIIAQGQQRQQQAQYQQAQMQEMRAKMQQVQMQNAQAQWDETGKQIVADPNRASNPIVKTQMTKLAATLGYTIPYKPDGSIDPSEWYPSFQDMLKDRDWSQRFFASDPAGKKAMAAQVSGVPKDLLDQGPVLTSNEQNAVNKYHLDDRRVTAMIQNNRDITAYRSGYYGDMGSAALTRAAAATETAKASMRRAVEYGQHVDNELKIARERSQTALEVARMRGDNVHSKTAINSAQRSYDSAQRAYDSFEAQIAQATTDGATALDPDALQALENKANGAYASLQDAKQQLRDAQDNMSHGDTGTGKDVSKQSGAQKVQVNDVAPKGSRHAKTQDGTDVWQYPDGSLHRKDGSLYFPSQQ